MRSFTAFAALSMLAAAAGQTTYRVSPGQDFEAECLLKVKAGDTCYLEKGDHKHDGLTRTHGTKDARITITGDPEACIKGSNTQDRAFQVAHDYYTIRDICFNGQHGDEYVATAIYVLGADKASNKAPGNIKSSVTGLELIDLTIMNFDEECIHLRYYVTFSEITGCLIQFCGKHSFEDGGGGVVGEAIYLGTALDQTNDNKAPEPKLRTGGADNVKADVTQKNWIHGNTMRTGGNECVDCKEGTINNLIEKNICEKQMDKNSGCFGSRGDYNTFRYNQITGCVGAGVRVGGDKGYGENNNIYGNEISSCDYGAFNVMAAPQGKVCGNSITSTDVVTQGAYKTTFDTDIVSMPCLEGDTPGEIEEFGTSGSASSSRSSDSESSDDDGGSSDTDDTVSVVPLAEDDDDDGVCAGQNCDDELTPEIIEIKTNSLAGTATTDCATVLKVVNVKVNDWDQRDDLTHPDNLFDGDLDTYFSLNKESTAIVLELETEEEVTGVAIGFFMKDAAEKRIQTFDIGVRPQDTDEYDVVWHREESSGAMGDIQHFGFRGTKTQYVKIESHGNTINNWTAYTEIHVCGAAVESNALFDGVAAAKNEIAALTEGVCAAPEKLAPSLVTATGDDNVMVLFDDNFETRWSTTATTATNDLDNGKITMEFHGEMKVTHVDIAFFDGHLAKPHFSLYKKSASEAVWTQILETQIAKKEDRMQTYVIQEEKVWTLYIVANGNDVGDYTKISEVAVYGC